jgi:hypothetical protein
VSQNWKKQIRVLEAEQRMNTLKSIQKSRARLRELVIQATTLTHQITDARESVKRVEDQVMNEIWSSDQFKNDRARNEQKHLARINDTRYITATELVRQYEIQKAGVHAEILVEQNVLAVATIHYQRAYLGEAPADVQLALKAVGSVHDRNHQDH